MTDLVDVIHNERTKLLASGLNTLGAASVGAGVIVPAAGSEFGLPSYSFGWPLIVLGVLWLLTGGVLHYCARLVLGGLRE